MMKKVYKANSWHKRMEKEFSKTTQSLSNEQIAMGKRYADMITRNREMSYYLK